MGDSGRATLVVMKYTPSASRPLKRTSRVLVETAIHVPCMNVTSICPLRVSCLTLSKFSSIDAWDSTLPSSILVPWSVMTFRWPFMPSFITEPSIVRICDLVSSCGSTSLTCDFTMWLDAPESTIQVMNSVCSLFSPPMSAMSITGGAMVGSRCCALLGLEWRGRCW